MYGVEVLIVKSIVGFIGTPPSHLCGGLLL